MNNEGRKGGERPWAHLCLGTLVEGRGGGRGSAAEIDLDFEMGRGVAKL